MRSRVLSLSMALGGAVAAVVAAAWIEAPSPSIAAEATVPPPSFDETAKTPATEKAVFAGGCFWGVQAVFQHVHGVKSATSGYAGGAVSHPRYEEVGTGLTGHAESVEVVYDPAQISYGKLLQVFFSVAHDPTELNRQGPDSGTQYRSALFTTTDAQREIAMRYVQQLQQGHVFGRPIVTEIKAADAFWPAETYHQNYATRHPDSPYIAYNDLPKVEALKDRFPELYSAQPVLLDVAGGDTHGE